MGLMSQFSGSLIGPVLLIHAKSRTWCQVFQPFRDLYLCFVVFCLLFLLTVGMQHRVFHSIITRNNHLNPKLIPKLLNNLGGKASDVMLKHLHKNKLYYSHNYYNNNNKICCCNTYIYREYISRKNNCTAKGAGT